MLRVLTIKCKPLETVNWVEGGRGVNLQIFAMWGERERERGGRGSLLLLDAIGNENLEKMQFDRSLQLDTCKIGQMSLGGEECF